MAEFLPAYEKTMGHEGGYSVDPDDAGGETYKGISRRYNPTWDGWVIIDSMKSHANFPAILKQLPQLQDKVYDFYKKNEWDFYKLDSFNSQLIAEEMFDSGVNLGKKRVSKFLQESLNYLNRNEKLFNDLIVDGQIGPASLRALDFILSNGEEELLFKILNILQAKFYLDYMKTDPVQEKYIRGWFTRVEFKK
jgi:lysozyme family protein